MTTNCLFCKIISGEIHAHKVYEDEKTLAFLDINPTAPGHTLIIPKTHVGHIEDMTAQDAEALFETLYKIIGVIKDAFNAPASTIGINNGKESGQEIPHVHIHVFPRRSGDNLGIIQKVSGFLKQPKHETLIENTQKIREKIDSLSLV